MKTLCIVIAILVITLCGALPAQARGHFSVWIGPGWGPWWGAYPYYPYPYYYWDRPAVMEQQPVYVEPRQQQEEQYYWYFCPDSKNYYPYVKKCPGGWLKVVPPSNPSDSEE